ncbi:MAG: hypothetical protein JWM04_509 [Verrucomicrobiales bacterium]|nr:hypothetical protein [Verrucomicrobiales bacterium]
MSDIADKSALEISSEKALHRLFLTLFLRGRTSRGLKMKGAPKSVFSKLWGMVLVYAAVGCIALLFRGQSIFIFSLSVHAMTFFILGSFIAGSTGEVLFNKEEGDILMHRPITAKALLWAKMSVLIKVSLWLAAAFNVAAFIKGLAFPHGWIYPIAHVISMGMNALFCTGSVVVVYQLCLRWFGREKLEGLMTSAQVVMALLIATAYQTIPRVMAQAGGSLEKIQGKWWIGLLPPAWFAGFDDALGGNGTSTSWILAGVGVAATMVIVWLAFIKLAGDYERGLQTMNEAVAPRKGSAGKRRWLDVLVHSAPMRWWLRDSVGRASFLLTAAYLFRDRDVKLRIYPGIAPMMAMPVVFLFQHTGFGVAFAGAYLGYIPLQALNMLQYSQHWQAADLFRSAPIAGPIQLCHGARRAVLVFLTFPLILLFALLAYMFAGGPSTLQLLLPGMIALPLYGLLPCLKGGAVPLSIATQEGKAASRNVALMICVMITSMVLAGMTQWSTGGGWYGRFLISEIVLLTVIYVCIRVMVAKTRWEPME